MRLPHWLIKSVVTALAAAMVGGVFAWAAGTSKAVSEQKTELAVQKEAQKSLEKSINKIEASQRRVEDKLDRVLEKRR